MDRIKTLRRIIVAICVLLLIFDVVTSFPESKYFDKNIKELVSERKAQVIEVGKTMKIDKDTILIERIINAKDKTYIRLAFIRFEPGWSFSDSVIKIIDDKGKQYEYHGGESIGKFWGQDDLIEIDKIDESAKYIKLKLDWYDRKNEITISL